MKHYIIKASETFRCPICHWRVTDSKEMPARTMMRQHMKYEHQIRGNRITLKKP